MEKMSLVTSMWQTSEIRKHVLELVPFKSVLFAINLPLFLINVVFGSAFHSSISYLFLTSKLISFNRTRYSCHVNYSVLLFLLLCYVNHYPVYDKNNIKDFSCLERKIDFSGRKTYSIMLPFMPRRILCYTMNKTEFPVLWLPSSLKSCHAWQTLHGQNAFQWLHFENEKHFEKCTSSHCFREFMFTCRHCFRGLPTIHKRVLAMPLSWLHDRTLRSAGLVSRWSSAFTSQILPTRTPVGSGW